MVSISSKLLVQARLCGQVEDALGELIQQLLSPYKCQLGRQGSELHLSIRATAQILTGEEQTKVV